MSVRHTRTIRRTYQLFVAIYSEILGRDLFKSRLSRWVVEVIWQVYTSSGVPLPFGVWPTPKGSPKVLD